MFLSKGYFIHLKSFIRRKKLYWTYIMKKTRNTSYFDISYIVCRNKYCYKSKFIGIEYIADLLGNNPSQSFKNALTIFAAIMQVFLFFVNILLLTALIKIVLSIVKLKVKFRELLRFVIIAQSPVILGLGIKYVLSDPSQYHIPVTSLAYLFSGLNMNQFVQIFLSKIELFNLWSLFLICLSLTIVTKQSLTKIVSILFPVIIIFNTLIELIWKEVNYNVGTWSFSCLWH